MDYHTFFLTNFSAIIWQQMVLVPIWLIKCLSSTETIVINASTNPNRGEMKSSKMRKGRNASKKVSWEPLC